MWKKCLRNPCLFCEKWLSLFQYFPDNFRFKGGNFQNWTLFKLEKRQYPALDRSLRIGHALLFCKRIITWNSKDSPFKREKCKKPEFNITLNFILYIFFDKYDFIILVCNMHWCKNTRTERIQVLQGKYSQDLIYICKEDMPEPCKYLTKKIRQELIYILQRGARSSYISYKEETPGAHIYLTKKIRKELIYLTRKIYQELIYLLQGRCHELIYLLGNFFCLH